MKQLEKTKEEKKQCRRCGVFKTFTSYSKCSEADDKLYKWCKQCVKEYRKDYFERLKRGENRKYLTNKRKGYEDNKFEEEKEKYIGLSHTQQQTRDMIIEDNDKIQKTIELYTWSYLLNAEFKIKSR